MIDQYYRVRAEVDLDAVRTNIINLKSKLKQGVKACAVIKADGYGHGAVPIAKATKDLVDFYAVATIEEALNLRAHEVFLPIIVIGFVHSSRFAAAIENDIRLTVFDYDTALAVNSEAAKKGKKAYVHLKLDTGMSRLGLPCDEDGLQTALKIGALTNLNVEGIFTHLYLADAIEKSSAYEQIRKYEWFTNELAENGLQISILHCANSAAVIDMPEAGFDMARLGIALYGLYPSEEVTSLKLHPALSLKSHIIMLKEIKPGRSVGYGATFKAQRPTKIATIPIGYADGYQRNLSNKGYVLIRGRRAPIAGRVCMDYIMVDVTDIEGVANGDEVVLIGTQGSETIAVEDLSALCGIFNYEFVCDIGKRVPRLYFREGKLVSTKDYFYDLYT